MMSEIGEDAYRDFMINEVQVGIDHPHNDDSNLLEPDITRQLLIWRNDFGPAATEEFCACGYLRLLL